MPLDITVDTKGLREQMRTVAEDQIPYATMRALNDCATRFQAEQRGHIQDAFTIRRPWVLQGVKINRDDFATKKKLSVRIHIDGQRDFFDKFERGGVRQPRDGKALAVPISVRRSKADVIAKRKRPKAFAFTEARSSLKSRVAIYKGKDRTFMIRKADGTGVILQRKGRGSKRTQLRTAEGKFMAKGGKERRRAIIGPQRYLNRNSVGRKYGHDYNLVVLWSLKGFTRVPKSLAFEENAKRSILSNWKGSFEKWYLESLGGRKGLNAKPTREAAGVWARDR